MKSIKILLFSLLLLNIQKSFSADGTDEAENFSWLNSKVILNYLNEKPSDDKITNNKILNLFLDKKIHVDNSLEKLIQYYLNVNAKLALQQDRFRNILLAKIIKRASLSSDIKFIIDFLQYSQTPIEDIEEIILGIIKNESVSPITDTKENLKKLLEQFKKKIEELEQYGRSDS